MKAFERLEIIARKIANIEQIVVESDNKIVAALNDDIKSKPAILMHIIAIAKQMKKIEDEKEFGILEKFSVDDIKGLNDVRNFIAHDYEGVDIFVIEEAIRYGLPSIKSVIEIILSEIEINKGGEKK